MVRAPCCAKVGLKRGPWTKDEDNILTSYIHQNGHPNWRALPKLAGLLRCGKSCRLRWANYLRPDIKRGNFSKEEEDTIIQLHQVLGNRWSVIAGKLPGRTDNEIKNVWHTHLKKRIQNPQNDRVSKGQLNGKANGHDSETLGDHKSEESIAEFVVSQPEVNGSPQQSSIEVSSVTEVRDSSTVVEVEQVDISEAFPEIDESFWTEALSTDGSSMQSDEQLVDVSSEAFDESFWTDVFSTDGSSMQSDFPILSPLSTTLGVESVDSWVNEGMDFWYDVFMKAEELTDVFL